MTKKFNNSIADSQATAVEAISPKNFDFDAYVDYDTSLQEKSRDFWQKDSGVLVYRRMRVAEVFSYGSKNMKNSLELQLGALQKSMAYKADIPNFLEPWYGIGTIASAYGASYHWAEGQAPAIKALFNNVNDALEYEPVPVNQTEIGRHTLEMIEYFLDNTKGKLPMSLTDTQSPLNVACNVIDISGFMLDTIMNPDEIKKFLNRITDLLIDFTHEQIKLIDDNLVWPGHGFASSREFSGIGMSDDNMLMMSGPSYADLVIPNNERFGNTFGGPVFHSCGNWADRIKYIMKIKNLKMVDGAFSEETDPNPNPTDGFLSFVDSDIILEARIVGSIDTVTEQVKKLWKPGMKLIVVTYSQTPQEQEIVYNRIHEICV